MSLLFMSLVIESCLDCILHMTVNISKKPSALKYNHESFRTDNGALIKCI